MDAFANSPRKVQLDKESQPMRVWSVAMTVGVALLSNVPAHADFMLENANPGSIPAIPKFAASSSRDVPAEATEQPVPRFKMARGFGDAVPIAFAVRQIVPAGVRVHYGTGIDPQSLVSWRGNQPWNQALAAAVRPLRLKIVAGTDIVLIAR